MAGSSTGNLLASRNALGGTALTMSFVGDSPDRMESVQLVANASLQVSVPLGWRLVGNRVNDSSYAIEIKADSGQHARCAFSVNHMPKPQPMNPAKIDASVTSACLQFSDLWVEKEIPLRKLNIQGGYGALAALTDARPDDKSVQQGDGYNATGLGLVQFGEDIIMTVNMLCDALEGPDFTALLKVVESVKIVRSGKL